MLSFRLGATFVRFSVRHSLMLGSVVGWLAVGKHKHCLIERQTEDKVAANSQFAYSTHGHNNAIH